MSTNGNGSAGASGSVLLQAQGLRKWYAAGRTSLGLRGPRRWLHAVDGVDLTVRQRELVGIVGESGSGKTTLAHLLLLLTDLDAGSVLFDGIDLHTLKPAELRRVRRRMQMVFQDPFSTLNP
ncbi:MAG: ATP-binding cassette domain-containing protein, partial [Actinobacteria bacterium]|nr:ATP-binding cassette domain-containing protein [Actinomycetota bacterium]